MAGFCFNYLLFSYISATIIYFILGLFASTGNVALLVEHYQLNSTKTGLKEGELDNVQQRTYSQYYLGASISLVISIVLLIFFLRDQKKNTEPLFQTSTINFHQEPDILNQHDNANNGPIELAQPSSDSNIIHTINTISSGMGENEI